MNQVISVKYFLIGLTTLAFTLSLNACSGVSSAQTTDEEKAGKSGAASPVTDYSTRTDVDLSGLRWVETAQAESDADKAIAAGDLRLWGYHQRGGPTIPGVDFQQNSILVEKYGMRTSPAVGDVIYNEDHFELLMLFMEYARSYNQRILSSEGQGPAAIPDPEKSEKQQR